jgi:23S rRNA pseudouridine2605 synthase
MDKASPDKLDPSREEHPLRLQKFLARAGVASRRGSEQLMSAGRVTVNGKPVTQLGSKVDPASDEVCVDGRRIELSGSHTYLMLNKPSGYLTTMDDPRRRPTVRTLVPLEEYPGLFPVGRLDCDTTGLLLFMTDGELAHRLLHPRHHVAKRYRATVEGRLTEAEAERLRSGILLDDGPTQPALVQLEETAHLPPGEAEAPPTTTVWLTITEGRKRQVRRMLAHVGHGVLTLEREALGPLELATLKSGTWRHLSTQEVEDLRQATAVRTASRTASPDFSAPQLDKIAEVSHPVEVHF